MKAKELSAQRELKNDGEPRLEIDSEAEQISADKPTVTIKEKRKSKNESNKPKCQTGDEEKKSVFVNGLAVGVGTGFIATFVVMWIAVFFSPQLPAGTTYQTMLSIFIYPLVYLLAVGSVTLTAGIVRQYYARQNGQAPKL
jgi:threonine/homoserine/homoserine lactone efflux protein